MLDQKIGAQPVKKSKKALAIAIVVIVILLFALVVCGVIGGVVYGIFSKIKTVEEYTCGLKTAKSDRRVIEMLGEPISDAFFVTPNIEISGSKRDVQFQVPLSGPKGSGDLIVVSYRDSFRSDFQAVLSKDGERTVIYRGTFPCK